jgi:hypothetical protein
VETFPFSLSTSDELEDIIFFKNRRHSILPKVIVNRVTKAQRRNRSLEKSNTNNEYSTLGIIAFHIN